MDVTDIIDRQHLGLFQLRIIVLCGLIQFFDGFDTQMIAYTAPVIMKDWNVPHAALGSVFAASLLGITCGTAFLSPMADRIGRKKILIIGVVIFSAMTLSIAMAQGIDMLMVLRFLTGIGLAAVIPCTTVMVNEYAPRARRATMVTMMSIGFAVGAASGGQLNAILLPLIGWRGTFVVGGVLPLVLVLALLRYLPESLRYLAVQGGRDGEITCIIGLMDPSFRVVPGTTFFVHHDGTPRRFRVLELFTRERVGITLLLWLAVCLSLLTMNFLNNWLPSVLTGAGLSVAAAVRTATLFQCGGIIGVLIMGWIADRVGFFPVLITAFVLAATVACSIGIGGGSIAVLMLAVPAAGFCVIGINNMLSALTATLHPTSIRATASGWANCFGHLGAMAGPVIGGILLGLHWPIENLFFLLAVVPVAGTCVMIAMATLRARQLRQSPLVEPTRKTA